jgi:hypothetical protein
VGQAAEMELFFHHLIALAMSFRAKARYYLRFVNGG